nr:MAG TPA: hypothetical protein [Caudoviricetes sp.]
MDIEKLLNFCINTYIVLLSIIMILAVVYKVVYL